MAKLSAVIITGNPKYISDNPAAKKYYEDIATYLRQLGVNDIIVNAGEPMTCPPKADLYIAHSRGCDRERCIKDDRTPFVKLGDPTGVIHPADLKWHEEVFKFQRGGNIAPVPEHYLFFKEQREAVRHAVETACKRNPVYVSPKSFSW